MNKLIGRLARGPMGLVDVVLSILADVDCGNEPSQSTIHIGAIPYDKYGRDKSIILVIYVDKVGRTPSKSPDKSD